jgi:predicted transposase YbfD/YdcC
MSTSSAFAEMTEHFAELTDPRVERTQWHELIDIVVVALCGVICGCDSWEDLPRYGRAKQDWLRRYLRLTNGMPSADTFARVFQRLDPNEFIQCMQAWLDSVRKSAALTDGQLVAIDGQTLKGSDDTAFGGRGPLHLVRAWAAEQQLVLGQLACAEKSNEIEAIPRLLALLNIEGAIVTIDAMGCQTDIAEKIIEKQADYVLSLKDNHPKFHQAVRKLFEEEQARAAAGLKPRYRVFTTHDTGHGRQEERTYYQMSVPKNLAGAERWKNLRSLGMVIRRRVVKGDEQQDVQFYLSSLPVKVQRLAKAIRGHWSIENQLHWMLDVTFAQDASRIRKGNGPEISSMLRQLALMILKQDTQLKGSLIGKRKSAGWSNDTLQALLLQISKR